MEIILALVMASVIGAVAGFIGTIMLTKRMSLVGGALGHLTLPGVALALTCGFDVSLGAAAILALGALLIWLIKIKTKLPFEALTAVVFATSVGITFLFISEEHTIQALIGDISQITLPATVAVVIVCAAIFYAVKKILPGLVLLGISQDLAKVQGINVKRYNLIYLACIAAIVALGVRIVGGLLTAALVAIPAASARNLSRNLKQYAISGALIGTLSCIAGVIGYSVTGLPAGPLIIIASGLIFLLSLIFKG